MTQIAAREALMEAFVIEGGKPLNGRVRAAGNKNGALPIVAACLLTEEPVTLTNVPRIRDVETMVEILVDIGADAEWTGRNELQVHAREVDKLELDPELCSRIRASFLLAGPLLARFGRVSVPPPGGDVIGRRRLEPHVQDLCRFLCALGASIEGIGSNVLRIEGVDSLHGGEWRIASEHIEVGSFIGLAAVTGGDLTVDDVRREDLVSLLPAFSRLGVEVELDATTVRVPPGQELVIQDDLGGQIPKIEDGPWPSFPADLTSIALAVATQAQGTILIFEKMFENRLFFVDKLVGMGARIILCDPHRVVVTGPARLYGERLSSPDIRAGMAMLIAALCAEGTSTIGNVAEIDRGYERIDDRLRSLGAAIERVDT